jgi:hypothetical protein
MCPVYAVYVMCNVVNVKVFGAESMYACARCYVSRV